MDYQKGGKQKTHYDDSEVTLRDCPLCDGDKYTRIYKERGSIGIVECDRCGLVYTNPLVKESEKNYWGQEEKYYQEARLIFKGVAPCHRDPNYLEDLNTIEKIKPEGNFLDIGTNMGFFLRHTRGRKWKTFGVEPSPALSEMARRYFGLNVKTGYLQNAGFEDSFFDVVTMTDVFEHIEEPKEMLGQIKRILKEDGILFIKVPNGNYSKLKLWMAKISGRLAMHEIFDSYEHLSHYSHDTLIRMLNESGFAVKKSLIGRPIQLPAWHKYVGAYYMYPSPWFLDAKNYVTRILFYWLSRIEKILRFGKIGYFASNIIVIVQKKK